MTDVSVKLLAEAIEKLAKAVELLATQQSKPVKLADEPDIQRQLRRMFDVRC